MSDLLLYQVSIKHKTNVNLKRNPWLPFAGEKIPTYVI